MAHLVMALRLLSQFHLLGDRAPLERLGAADEFKVWGSSSTQTQDVSDH